MRFFSAGSSSAAVLPIRQEEQRVVAETVRPARRARDLAAPDSFGDQRQRVDATPTSTMTQA